MKDSMHKNSGSPGASDPIVLVKSRAVVERNYAILTPEGIPAAPIPGWTDVDARILTAPAMGARFSMILLDIPGERGGRHSLPADIQGFLFVVDGRAMLGHGGTEMELGRGGYAYLPPGSEFELRASGGAARVLWTRKRFEPLGDDRPRAVFGDETRMAGDTWVFGSGNPLLPGTSQVMEGVILKTLLPDEMIYDMAMNIFTFPPGRGLPITETHVMEHGLLFLEGQGVYLLGDTWYEVREGDFIWMGPYAPQSFYATGQTPARYLYYKNVHRDIAL
jgi:(S)-ureidoglycine aminohydrolase